MKKLEFIDLEACDEAADWASGKTWEEVYATCHRGEWLLWLFAKTNPKNFRELTLAKGHCANTVRHLMKDERSIAAVDAAIAFGEGKITKGELDAAFYASAYASASASASAAYANASANASANAAADAAFASFAAANAATYAAFASYAAYATDDAATYAATGAYATAASYAADAAAGYAEKKNQQQTADICRKYLPIELWNIKN